MHSRLARVGDRDRADCGLLAMHRRTEVSNEKATKAGFDASEGIVQYNKIHQQGCDIMFYRPSGYDSPRACATTSGGLKLP